MINYVKINNILPYVSKAVLEESSQEEILSEALRGYELLASRRQTKEQVFIYTVKDHKTELSDDTIIINSVYRTDNTLSDVYKKYCDCPETPEVTDNGCVGNYAIAHKLSLDSPDFKNSFYPMKYIGISSYVCDTCVNMFCHDCNETFSVDENKVLWTSFKDGTLCVKAKVTITDEEGDYLIVDDEDVKKYLALHAELEHFRNRMYRHEQGVTGIVDRLESKSNVFYNRARSSIKKLSLNPQLIGEITNNSRNAQFFKFLPDNYRRKYDL